MAVKAADNDGLENIGAITVTISGGIKREL
jgi:hypothetical protein